MRFIKSSKVEFFQLDPLKSFLYKSFSKRNTFRCPKPLITHYLIYYEAKTSKLYECYLLIPEVWKDALEVGSWSFGETSLLVRSECRFSCGNDFGALADKVLENSFFIVIPTLSAITR